MDTIKLFFCGPSWVDNHHYETNYNVTFAFDDQAPALQNGDSVHVIGGARTTAGKVDDVVTVTPPSSARYP